MTGLALILAHVLPFGLVVARLAGLFIAAPLLSSVGVPMRAKALLVLALAAAIYPVLPASAQTVGDLSLMDLVPMVIGEMMVGGTMGALAAVPVLLMDSAGVIGGQMMGMGLARVYNPEMDSDADVLGQLLFLLAGGAFVAMGGIEQLFLALTGTFHHIAPGGLSISQAPLAALVAVLGSGCELAIRVSMPIMGAVMLLVVVFGAIGKTMPQINIMTVGFTAKVLAGLAMMAMGTAAAGSAIGDAMHEAVRNVCVWAAGL
ncbi:MAG: flagellar biosynthetic protein FliR [Planctomycetota bacterium]